MKSRLIIIILLVFSLSTEAQIRSTFWSTIRNTIRHAHSTNPPIEKAFYISSTGSDSNPGTLAEPFQTLDKINSLSLTDTLKVYFKRGDSFNGTLTAQSDSITYGSYGTGEYPKIYGSNIITGWSVHSGNIYKASFTTDITQLFINDEKMQSARLNNSTYNNISSVTSQTVFVTNVPSQADNYYVGCTMLIKSNQYKTEIRTVTASTGSTLTINTATTSATVTANCGFILMNKLEFVDSPGEWYYDSVADLVYAWMPNSDSPASYEIRGSTLTNGINVNGKNYITINNLNILQQKETGVIANTGTSTNLTVKNCTIKDAELYGIYMLPAATFMESVLIENNEISGTNDAGIYGYYVHATIKDNYIHDISTFENIGLRGVPYADGVGIALSTINTSDRSVIEYNRIKNIGYNGILWRGQTDIRYNNLDSCMISKNDGGAIYCGSANGATSIVEYNVITNTTGSKAGTIDDYQRGEGIYLDEATTNITVRNNTVLNGSANGIFLHRSAGNHNVNNNTVFNTAISFLAAGSSAAVTNQIKHNLFVSGSETHSSSDGYQLLTSYSKGAYNEVVYLTQDSNQYINPYSHSNVYSSILKDQPSTTYYTFADWKTALSQDLHSVYSGTALSTDYEHTVLTNVTKTVQTKYFNNTTNATDKDGNAVSSNIVLQPFTSFYIRGKGISSIGNYPNSTPTILTFDLPITATSTTVSLTFSAQDNDGITGYYLNETGTNPAIGDGGWVGTAPTSYTFSTDGSKTLYGWVKDSAGNISARSTDSVTITLLDVLSNVVAWYEGNNATGTTIIDSKGGTSGTLYNGALTGQSGSIGSSMTFDGTDDYCTVPRPALFDASLTNSFSVMARFKVITAEASNRVFAIDVNYTTFIHLQMNSLNAIATVSKAGTGYVKQKTTGLSTGTWYTMFITFDTATNTIKFYVNGTEETTAGSLGGNNGGSTLIHLARVYASSTYANQGIETFAIFNRVLTPTEITTLQTLEYNDL